MTGSIVVRILAVLVCLVLVVEVDSRPWYIECTDSNECGFDACCVVGSGRFSLPRCLTLKNIYSICRPVGQFPINATVSYPDGESVDLTNVFSIMCPCQPGLYCSERTGTCQHMAETLAQNSIY